MTAVCAVVADCCATRQGFPFLFVAEPLEHDQLRLHLRDGEVVRRVERGEIEHAVHVRGRVGIERAASTNRLSATGKSPDGSPLPTPISKKYQAPAATVTRSNETMRKRLRGAVPTAERCARVRAGGVVAAGGRRTRG